MVVGLKVMDTHGVWNVRPLASGSAPRLVRHHRRLLQAGRDARAGPATSGAAAPHRPESPAPHRPESPAASMIQQDYVGMRFYGWGEPVEPVAASVQRPYGAKLFHGLQLPLKPAGAGHGAIPAASSVEPDYTSMQLDGQGEPVAAVQLPEQQQSVTPQPPPPQPIPPPPSPPSQPPAPVSPAWVPPTPKKAPPPPQPMHASPPVSSAPATAEPQVKQEPLFKEGPQVITPSMKQPPSTKQPPFNAIPPMMAAPPVKLPPFSTGPQERSDAPSVKLPPPEARNDAPSVKLPPPEARNGAPSVKQPPHQVRNDAPVVKQPPSPPVAHPPESEHPIDPGDQRSLWLGLEHGPIFGTDCARMTWGTERGWVMPPLTHCLCNVEPEIKVDWVKPVPETSSRSWAIHVADWRSLRSCILYLHKSIVHWPGDGPVHAPVISQPFVRPLEFKKLNMEVQLVDAMTREEMWSTWANLAGHGPGADSTWCGPVGSIWTHGGHGPKEVAFKQFPLLTIPLLWPPIQMTGWWHVNQDALQQNGVYQEWLRFLHPHPLASIGTRYTRFTMHPDGPVWHPNDPPPPPVGMGPFTLGFTCVDACM